MPTYTVGDFTFDLNFDLPPEKPPEPTYFNLVLKNLKEPHRIEEAIGKMNSEGFEGHLPYSLLLVTADKLTLFISVEHSLRFKLLKVEEYETQTYQTFDFNTLK